MKTTLILLALAFGFTACSASTDEQLRDDDSVNGSHTYNSLISKTTAYPTSLQRRQNIKDALNA